MRIRYRSDLGQAARSPAPILCLLLCFSLGGTGCSGSGESGGSSGSLEPDGAQFQVNTYTTGGQYRPSVSSASNGDFVVVWQSYGSDSDTSFNSVQGQRYASSGSPQGGEFEVNTYTTGGQYAPSVSSASNGDFVVVWQSYGSVSDDTSSGSVQGQRYASSGSPQGGQFQVNTYTTSGQRYPSVSSTSNGDFVVVWDSFGSDSDNSRASVQGQRYASSGSPQGGQFQVNTYTTSLQYFPSVSSASNGDFVVVWQSNGSDSDNSGGSVQGQRYASSGSPQGGQFQVNTYTTSGQARPSVSSASNGDFVVVWRSDGSDSDDTSAASVQGQRYASSGSPQGGQFQVNTYTTSYQVYPSVSSTSNGDFVVVWQSYGSSDSDNSSDSVQGQRYASSGSPQGGQFEVNTYTTSGQVYPSVSSTSNEDFVVVWGSAGSDSDDNSSLSVQGQRFSIP